MDDLFFEFYAILRAKRLPATGCWVQAVTERDASGGCVHYYVTAVEHRIRVSVGPPPRRRGPTEARLLRIG